VIGAIAGDAPPAAPGPDTNIPAAPHAPAETDVSTGMPPAPGSLSDSQAALRLAQSRPPVGEAGPSGGLRDTLRVTDAPAGKPALDPGDGAPDPRLAAHPPAGEEIGSRQPAGEAQMVRLPPLSGGLGAALGIAQPATVDGGALAPPVARAEGIIAVEPGPDPAARQVALQITRALEHDRTEIRIQLDPPDLGEVDIQLEFRDLRLCATVSAERPDTLDLLQRDARSLARALREAGVELADSDLSFASGGRHERPDAGTSGQRATQLAHSLAAPAPLRDRPLPTAQPEGLVSLSEGRLDLRV
jgi:hypothetical protein